MFSLNLSMFSSLEKPYHSFFPFQKLCMTGICYRNRIRTLFGLTCQSLENMLELFYGMKSYLFEIKEFCDRRLIMKISIIEGNERIGHCILKISQIKF